MTASPHFGLPRMEADFVVAGPGVKGERSESRSDCADAATGLFAARCGRAAYPVLERRGGGRASECVGAVHAWGGGRSSAAVLQGWEVSEVRCCGLGWLRGDLR